MSMSSNILELVIYERKKVFKKKLLLGVLPLCNVVYCLAGKGTMDITHEWCPKITSGEATSDFGTTSV
jgi:hypothetical protein